MAVSNAQPATRFSARKEHFGLLIYDKKRAKMYVAQVDGLADTQELVLDDGEGAEVRIDPTEINMVGNYSAPPKDALSGPTYAEIYPTMNCNERCFFCYVGDSLTYAQKGMSREVVNASIKSISESGLLTASILGGEPFLYRDLEYLAQGVCDAGTNLSISTNGTIRNLELFKKLIKLYVGFNISFHSHIPEIHNKIVNNPIGYKNTVETLKFIISNTTPFYVNVSIVANYLNYKTLPDTIRFINSLGINSVSIYHAQGSGFSLSNKLSELTFSKWVDTVKRAEALGKSLGMRVRAVTNYPFLVEKDLEFSTDLGLSRYLYGTGDGRRTVYINYDGNVYPTSYNFPDNRFLLGNIVKLSLSDMWHNSDILKTLREEPVQDQCRKCDFFELCRGGPITNYKLAQFAKEYSRTTPNCPIYSENTIE